MAMLARSQRSSMAPVLGIGQPARVVDFDDQLLDRGRVVCKFGVAPGSIGVVVFQ
jgi:hypothetical protein